MQMGVLVEVGAEGGEGVGLAGPVRWGEVGAIERKRNLEVLKGLGVVGESGEMGC